MGMHTATQVPNGPRPLELLTEAADRLDGIRRGDLGPGDRLMVATRNSIYALTAKPDGRFEARGGWFERAGQSPAEVGVVGCTAGGSALFTRIVAAPGLFLEFDDGTRTTRIQRVRLVRSSASAAAAESPHQ
jgi:hypothetical protein